MVMNNQQVNTLANEILSQTVNHLIVNPNMIIEDERILRDSPFIMLDAIGIASKIICEHGFSFEAKIDSSKQIPIIKYRVFKK